MKMTLEKVRLSFPALAKPEDYQGDGKFKYKATFLIEAGSAQAKKVDDALAKVAADKWLKRAPAILKELLLDKKGCCWIDGSRYEYDGYAGHMKLTAMRKVDDGRPAVVDIDKSPLYQADGTPYPGKEGRIYSGCFVDALVEFYAQDSKDGKGLRCALRGVRFRKDGEAFSGASKASADEFEDLDVSEDDDGLT
jgi:hypothetical protein